MPISKLTLKYSSSTPAGCTQPSAAQNPPCLAFTAILPLQLPPAWQVTSKLAFIPGQRESFNPDDMYSFMRGRDTVGRVTKRLPDLCTRGKVRIEHGMGRCTGAFAVVGSSGGLNDLAQHLNPFAREALHLCSLGPKRVPD